VRACAGGGPDVLTHVGFLGSLLLLSFDVRIDPTLPYRGWVSCVACGDVAAAQWSDDAGRLEGKTGAYPSKQQPVQ